SCIHSLLPPPCPVNEVRVLCSAGLCCPRLLGTMTLSESLPAACHFTLRAYRFAVYDFCRAGEGFPSSRHSFLCMPIPMHRRIFPRCVSKFFTRSMAFTYAFSRLGFLLSLSG